MGGGGLGEGGREGVYDEGNEMMKRRRRRKGKVFGEGGKLDKYIYIFFLNNFDQKK